MVACKNRLVNEGAVAGVISFPPKVTVWLRGLDYFAEKGLSCARKADVEGDLVDGFLAEKNKLKGRAKFAL